MGEGVPLWSMASMVAEGPSTSQIGSVSLSLSVSALLGSALSPFLLYPEICNSDWTETFAQSFLRKLAFLRQKKSANRLRGGSRGWGARPGGSGAPPYLVTTSGNISRGFFFRIFPYFPKISSVRFYPVWTPFDMGILRNQKHAIDRNWHWHWNNMLVPKII